MAWRLLVNKLLQDGRIKQRETANEEAGVNSFDRRVVDTRRPQGGVYEVVEQRDHHNDGDRVDVTAREKDVSRVLECRSPAITEGTNARWER